MRHDEHDQTANRCGNQGQKADGSRLGLLLRRLCGHPPGRAGRAESSQRQDHAEARHGPWPQSDYLLRKEGSQMSIVFDTRIEAPFGEVKVQLDDTGEWTCEPIVDDEAERKLWGSVYEDALEHGNAQFVHYTDLAINERNAGRQEQDDAD